MGKSRETTKASRKSKKRRGRPAESCRDQGLQRLLQGWRQASRPRQLAKQFPKPYLKPKSEKRRSWNSKRRRRKLRRCWKPRRLATVPWMQARKFAVPHPRQGCCNGHSVTDRSVVPIALLTALPILTGAADGAVDGASAVAKTRWCRRSAN